MRPVTRFSGFKVNFNLLLIIATIIPFLFKESLSASPKRRYSCSYKDKNGLTKITESRKSIPPYFRAQARCRLVTEQEDRMDRPKSLALKSEEIEGFLGVIKIKWSPDIEASVTSTSLSGIKDAISSAEKYLKSLPSSFTKIRDGFSVTLINENTYGKKIPYATIGSCHPGWITNSNEIMLLSRKLDSPCYFPSIDGLSRKSLEATFQTLHFLGHLLDSMLIAPSKKQSSTRTESFALWFSVHASGQSSLFSDKKNFQERLRNLSENLKSTYPQIHNNFLAKEYRGAIAIELIVQSKGVNGLMDLYDVIKKNESDLDMAVMQLLEIQNKAQLTKMIEELAIKKD